MGHLRRFHETEVLDDLMKEAGITGLPTEVDKVKIIYEVLGWNHNSYDSRYSVVSSSTDTSITYSDQACKILTNIKSNGTIFFKFQIYDADDSPTEDGYRTFRDYDTYEAYIMNEFGYCVN